MLPEVNVLALVKGAERFVYVYDDASHADLIATLRDHAADPGLSLSWFDATVLTTKAREQVRANQTEPDIGPPRNRESRVKGRDH
jgi:hypothetical protein